MARVCSACYPPISRCPWRRHADGEYVFIAAATNRSKTRRTHAAGLKHGKKCVFQNEEEEPERAPWTDAEAEDGSGGAMLDSDEVHRRAQVVSTPGLCLAALPPCPCVRCQDERASARRVLKELHVRHGAALVRAMDTGVPVSDTERPASMPDKEMESSGDMESADTESSDAERPPSMPEPEELPHDVTPGLFQSMIIMTPAEDSEEERRSTQGALDSRGVVIERVAVLRVLGALWPAISGSSSSSGEEEEEPGPATVVGGPQ